MSCIYAIICPETKEVKYVGKTKFFADSRVKAHIRNARGGKFDYYLHRWIRSLGNTIPEFIVLEENPEDLNSAEIYWIRHYRELQGSKLCNMTDGGDGGKTRSTTGKVVTAEWRKNISEGVKKYIREHPEEIARKARKAGDSKRGKPVPLDTRTKISSTLKAYFETHDGSRKIYSSEQERNRESAKRYYAINREEITADRRRKYLERKMASSSKG